MKNKMKGLNSFPIDNNCYYDYVGIVHLMEIQIPIT